MSALNRHEKLEIARELCEKHKITAYEIGEGTGLDVTGIQRILNGETLKPRESTLHRIMQYLDQKIIGRSLPNHLNYQSKTNEPAAAYKLDETKIMELIQELKSIMIRNHDAFAQGIEKTILNTEEIKRDTNTINSSVDSLISTIKGRKP